MKLNPTQCCVESAGHTFKHILVTLTGAQEIAVLRETPGAWKLIQANRGLAVRRGDTVSIISADGLVLAEALGVKRAMGGDVWLDKPLRIRTLEPDILYEGAAHSVIPVGTGFSIKHNRGQTEDRVFATVEAACAWRSTRANPGPGPALWAGSAGAVSAGLAGPEAS